jgi:hypothetical protein
MKKSHKITALCAEQATCWQEEELNHHKSRGFWLHEVVCGNWGGSLYWCCEAWSQSTIVCEMYTLR